MAKSLPVIRDVLAKTEGLTYAQAQEDRSLYDHIPSTDFTVRHMSQISVNYTEPAIG